MHLHRTYCAKILNHAQVRGALDRCGFSASKLWNVARFHIDHVWEATGKLPDEGTLKSHLKSSGHDTRTPPVTWNEWKTASTSEVQELYYLYIVGNLRKDVQSEPYIRELPNPFSLLNAETWERREVKKEVKVDVTSFKKRAEIRETPISVNQETEE